MSNVTSPEQSETFPQASVATIDLPWWHNLSRLWRPAGLVDLESVRAELPSRGNALNEAITRLKDLSVNAPGDPILTQSELFRLGSTDLFVEKAQMVLTRRARWLYLAGGFTIFGTFLLILTTIGLIGYQGLNFPPEVLGLVNLSKYATGQPGTEVGNWVLVDGLNATIIKIFQGVALSAIALVGVKYLISLGRSFFHEGESLLQRRHALRFGRLYVYLKKGNVDLENLEKMFEWNKEIRTAYLDLHPEVVAETIFHRIVDSATKMPPESLRVVSEAFARATEKTK